MAFCLNFLRHINAGPIRMAAFKIIMRSKSYLPNQSRFEVQEDALDMFTTDLMSRKNKKWESKKTLVQGKARNAKSGTPYVSGIVSQEKIVKTINSLHVDDLDSVFQYAIDGEDVVLIGKLVRQCTKYNKIPSTSIVLSALSVSSQNGDKTTVLEIVQLCEKLSPALFKDNSQFEHYLAQAIWIKGNTIQSLQLFEKVYKENSYLRRIIRCILKYLILDCITKHSEATLVNIIKFSEMLYENYNDDFCLSCIWQACCLSEWFTDQQKAFELLERNDRLIEAVLSRIPYIVRLSLQDHRTDIVYRLTEVLLKFKIETELVQVLLSLIDYWIKQGGLKQVNEIIAWSYKNNIVLPTVIENEKMAVLHDKCPEKNASVVETPKTDYKF